MTTAAEKGAAAKEAEGAAAAKGVVTDLAMTADVEPTSKEGGGWFRRGVFTKSIS